MRKYDLTLYEGGLNECNQCKYKTPRKGDLKIHIKSKHEGVCYSCVISVIIKQNKGEALK